MKQYYYLITSLKDLSIDQDKIPIEISTFIEDVQFEVDGKDLDLFNLLRLHFDNLNVVRLLKKEGTPFLPYGLFNEEKLAEELAHPADLPPYLLNFIAMVKDDEREFPSLSLEDEVTVHYFRYLKTFKNEIIQKYVDFDFHLRNVMAALNLKAKKIPSEGKILFLDDSSYNLMSSNQEGFGLLHDVDWLQNIMEIYQSGNILERERKLLEAKFDLLDRILEFEEFGISRILGHLIKLQLLERWTSLKDEAGLKVIEDVTDKLSDDKKIFTGTY